MRYDALLCVAGNRSPELQRVRSSHEGLVVLGSLETIPRARGKPRHRPTAFFHSLFLRSDKILLRNSAILRNTLRMLNRQIPSVGNAVQSCEMMRNSLGLNYKSAAVGTELCDRIYDVGVSKSLADNAKKSDPRLHRKV
jgi:hypothetical protein